jgi:hypothetical protein
MPVWREKHSAVMGCVVNGPGESKHANIGTRSPGTFEDPVAPAAESELSATPGVLPLRGLPVLHQAYNLSGNDSQGVNRCDLW